MYASSHHPDDGISLRGITSPPRRRWISSPSWPPGVDIIGGKRRLPITSQSEFDAVHAVAQSVNYATMPPSPGRSPGDIARPGLHQDSQKTRIHTFIRHVAIHLEKICR